MDKDWLEDCTARSSLRGLAFALRHPETWPAGFIWDFGSTHHDAAALCHKLWGGPPGWNEIYWDGLLGRLNNIPRRDALRLLFSQATYFLGMPVWWRAYSKITPATIAGRIDRYLADKPEEGWPEPARVLRGNEWI